VSVVFDPARLRAARQKTGLSQRAVAARLGRCGAAITQYETGTRMPSAAILISLAELYGVKVEELCSERGRPFRPPTCPRCGHTLKEKK